MKDQSQFVIRNVKTMDDAWKITDVNVLKDIWENIVNKLCVFHNA